MMRATAITTTKMMKTQTGFVRPYNFAAGPATMPEEVLAIAQRDMCNWQNSGMSVMEMSHRGKDFGSIHEQALANVRELLAVPEHFKILFMQGGGLAENAIVPLNIAKGTDSQANFVTTGGWSEKSAKEAQKYTAVHVCASNASSNYTTIPEIETWKLSKNPSYVHVCHNETIHGVEHHSLPTAADLKGVPLVLDFSSNVASQVLDWNNIGVAFGGAQKNLGPAGLTLVVVREDLLGRASAQCPSAFDYTIVSKNNSLYNTPPTFAIYMAGLVFDWLKKQGGVLAMQELAMAKSDLLYACIDSSNLYYNRVMPFARSRMNVPFFLHDEKLNAAFLDGANAAGLLQLKGHKSLGGMRASLYNAMPISGVHALVQYMRDFESNL